MLASPKPMIFSHQYFGSWQFDDNFCLEYFDSMFFVEIENHKHVNGRHEYDWVNAATCNNNEILENKQQCKFRS